MTMPNIQGSTPQGGGITLRSFGVGRAVLIFPVQEETGTDFSDKTKPKQFMRCNVVALPDPQSAPFITYGGEVLADGVTVKVPDTMRVDLGPHGFYTEGVRIGGGGMLYILRRALETGSARVGRLYKDDAHSGAWKLTDCDKEKINGMPNPHYEPQLITQAGQWIQLYQSGNFQNSYPVAIAQVPAQATGGMGSMPAQQPPAQSWPTNPAPAAQQAPQGWGQPAPQQPQPAYAGPQQPPAQGWGAPQQPAPAAPQGWGQPPAQPGQQPHPGF